MSALEGWRYAYSSFIWLLLLFASGTFLFQIYKPYKKRKENRLEFNYK